MKPQRVVLIGGSGFIGRAVAAELCAAGVQMVAPSRDRVRAASVLGPLPTCELVAADVHDPAALHQLLAGADAVVNLVGVLHSRSGQPWGPAFERAHVALPRKLVEACAATGVSRLVHISALGADPQGPSEYQRSKAAGEAAIRAAGPDLRWTIFRPSVVFGPQDQFLNLFAGLVRLFPVIPLAGAHTRFQPVFVEDVARCVAHALLHEAGMGEVLPLGGPRVYTLGELVEYVGGLVGRKPLVLPLPDGLAMLQAGLMECLPQAPMSRDNVRSLRVDNILPPGPCLPFGLHATALEAVAPAWLAGGGSRGAFYAFRRAARRSPGNP